MLQMNYPSDWNSLRRAARIHKFRQPMPGESKDVYRGQLADHLLINMFSDFDRFQKALGIIDSEEIRNGIGWDEFSQSQMTALMDRLTATSPLGSKT